MKNKVEKVLFVGLGGVGQRHLRNLKAIKGESVGIFAYRKRNSQFVLNNKLEIMDNEELNVKYGITCVASLEEAFALGVNTVFICNPTSMHMEILIEALKAGCNIFVEKPVSANLNGFEEAEGWLKKKKNITFVGYQNRYHPCIKKAKELLDRKAIGDIVSVHSEIGECVKNWHKYEDYRTMYACRKELGGGVIVTQIHELDYLYYLFGTPKTVYAIGGKLSDLEIDVEDVADILMGYELGGKYVPVSVHEDYIQAPARRECRIVGTEGKIEFDLLSSSFVMFDGTGGIQYSETYEFERNDMFMSELKEFIDCIEKNRNPSISLPEGKKSLEMAMAVKESIKTGVPIEFGKFAECGKKGMVLI